MRFGSTHLRICNVLVPSLCRNEDYYGPSYYFLLEDSQINLAMILRFIDTIA